MDNPNIQRIELEHIYGKISPFELKDRLISLAKESQIEKKCPCSFRCRKRKSKLDSGSP